MSKTFIIETNWQPEPTKNLVESKPVKEGTKLETPFGSARLTWEDLRGLTGFLIDDYPVKQVVEVQVA